MSALDQFFPCDDKCALPCRTHKQKSKRVACSDDCGCVDTFFRGTFHRKYGLIRIINGESHWVNEYTWKTMRSMA